MANSFGRMKTMFCVFLCAHLCTRDVCVWITFMPTPYIPSNGRCYKLCCPNTYHTFKWQFRSGIYYTLHTYIHTYIYIYIYIYAHTHIHIHAHAHTHHTFKWPFRLGIYTHLAAAKATSNWLICSFMLRRSSCKCDCLSEYTCVHYVCMCVYIYICVCVCVCMYV